MVGVDNNVHHEIVNVSLRTALVVNVMCMYGVRSIKGMMCAVTLGSLLIISVYELATRQCRIAATSHFPTSAIPD